MRLKQECTITQFSVNKTFNINITYFFRIFPKDLKQKRKKNSPVAVAAGFQFSLIVVSPPPLRRASMRRRRHFPSPKRRSVP